MHFTLGQCQTIKPLITTIGSWRSFGYSIALTHDVNSSKDTPTQDPPGWHLYIHDPKEKFSGKTKTNENTKTKKQRIKH